MIYSDDPSDWKDLQNRVAAILRDVGCVTAIEKRIDTARGPVAIDVYAEDPLTVPPAVYICECKHWHRPVPKSVVHTFQAVLSNLGANYAFIVSRSGFQRGATEAARNTAMQLVTWHEFQALFDSRWNEAVTEEIFDMVLRLETLLDPEDDDAAAKIAALDPSKFAALSHLRYVMFRLSLILSTYMSSLGALSFPLGVSDVFANDHQRREIDVPDKYRLIEYFRKCIITLHTEADGVLD